MTNRATVPAADNGRALTTLADMVRFDTRTMSTHESALAGWLADRMSGLGLDARLVPVDGDRVNAVGIWPGSGDGPSLMFNGHVDTNPLTEGWTRDPWGADLDDGYIYGLGVSNMKAGCAAYLEAINVLSGTGWRPRGDVILTFVVGELQNGVGTRALLKEGYRADYFLNCEPTDLTAITTHAGAATFKVRLLGSTRHLSKREEAGDALAAAAQLVPILNNLTFSQPGNEPTRATNRVHVGVLQAGLGKDMLASRPPQVADVAELLGSVRFGPGQDARTIMKDLQHAVNDACSSLKHVTGSVNCVTDGGPSMDRPFHVDPHSLLVRILNEAYQAVRGTAQPTGAIQPYCYYGSDASLLQHLGGITGVVCGPGGEFNTMPDERVAVTDYLDAIQMYTAIVKAMSSGEDQPS